MREHYAEAFNNIKSKALRGLFSPNDRESAINSLAGQLSKATAGRYTEYDAKKLIQSIFPQTTDFSEETLMNKFKRGMGLFDEEIDKLTPQLAVHGIQIPKRQEAPVIKKMGGVSYQKVPGGWKRLP